MKFILVIFLFFLNFVFCQTNKSVELLIDKFDATIFSNPDSSFYYINTAKNNSIKLGNEFLLARCVFKTGYFYYLKKELSKAEILINESILLSNNSKNFKTLSAAYNQLGIIHMDNNDYIKSLNFFLISLDIAKKYNFPINESRTLNNLGNLYSIQKDSVKSLGFYLKNEKLALKNKFKDVLLLNYSNIALLMASYDKEKAEVNHLKALKLARELNDSYQQFRILINLSDLYLTYPYNLNLHKALKSIQKAHKFSLNNPQNLFYVYFNYGGYYNKTKNFDQAETYYLKAKALSNSGVDNEQLLNLDKALEKNYKAKGDFKNAYLYQEKFQKTKDSVFTIEKSKTFNDIQTKYEVEKKNLKIDLLSKEKIIEQNKKQIILYIGLALLLPLSFLLLFYRNRIKLQKIISQKETELFLQEKTKLQQEQELKRVIGLVEGQDQERNRIAKEIHDGVGGELAGIKLNLSQINLTVKNEKITSILTQLNGLFQELRNISHNLSSNFIKNKDFSAVLFELKAEYDNRNEFETEITVYPENAFEQTSENVKHQIYRIIQELLANISKHAMAINVSITITNHDNLMNIIIEDDGKGFEDNVTNGIGLKNIEERIESLNGKLLLETEPNKGSTFIIDIPIQPI